MDKIDDFYNILEQGDIRLNKRIQKAYCLVGHTRRGKTTSSYYLSNNPLKGYKDNNGQIRFKSEQNKGIIGHQHNSQTQIPNFFPIKNSNTFVIDFPGYGDANGVNRILSNGYFNYQLFSKIPQIKFIIVFSEADFTKIADVQSTLNQFINSFRNFSQIRQTILKSTVMLVTKVNKNNELTVENTIPSLLRDLGQKKHHHYQDIVFILEDLKKHKKIFKFHQANDNQITQQNNLLEQIGSSIQWWKRQIINQNGNIKVIVDNIKLSVLNQCLNPRIGKQNVQLFKRIIQHFQAKVKVIVKEGIIQIFKQILIEAFKQQNSHNFMDKIQKFQKQYYNYSEENDKKEIRQKFIKNLKNKYSAQYNKNFDGIQLYWLKKIKVGQLIWQLSQLLDKVNEKRSLEWLELVQNSLFNIIFQFDKIAYENANIEKYNYIIYRTMQQIKIIYLILGNDKKIANNVFEEFEMVDYCLELSDSLNQIQIQNFNYKEYKIKYATGLKIYKGLQHKKQHNKQQNKQHYKQLKKKYQEILHFIHSLGQIQNKPDRKKINLTKLRLNIYIAQLQITKSKNNQIISKNLEIINNCRLDLEKQLQVKDYYEENICLIINTIQILITYFKTKNNLDLMIICYHSINDASKIIETMQQKLRSPKNNNTQKRQGLVEMGKYAATHGRKQLAIKSLQQAYSLCQKISQKKQISSLLSIIISSSDSQNSKQYINCLIEEKFYQPISQKTNKRILSEIK